MISYPDHQDDRQLPGAAAATVNKEHLIRFSSPAEPVSWGHDCCPASVMAATTVER
jgi:hypothetical protein